MFKRRVHANAKPKQVPHYIEPMDQTKKFESIQLMASSLTCESDMKPPESEME
jgi:hypothetical protein